MNLPECPTAETLSRWRAGLLDDSDADRVADHLDECALCEQAACQPCAPRVDEREFRLQLDAECPELIEDLARIPSLDADSSGATPLVDGYRIIRELGRGGMGVVYEAEHEALKRRVALKILPGGSEQDETVIRRFYVEAKAAARLHHTSIVPVFDIGNTAHTHFYAMQLIEGVSLSHVISEIRHASSTDRSSKRNVNRSSVSCQASKRLWSITTAFLSEDTRRQDSKTHGESLWWNGSSQSETASAEAIEDRDLREPDPVDHQSYLAKDFFARVAELGRQVASGLGYAHQNGIIHRDIKPANLMLDMAGNAWIADFGLAKTDNDELTRTGQIVGTLRFIAPERFQNQCDHRGDIYSLGISLYEMLTLSPALDASDQAGLFRQIQNEDPPSLLGLNQGIPRDLATIVHKSIAKDPNRRYQSSELMADDLVRFLEGRPIQARPVSHLEKLVIWSRRNPLVACMAALLIVALLSAAMGSSWAAIQFREMARVQTGLANDARRATIQADRSRVEAEREAFRTEGLLYASDMRLAGDSIASAGGIPSVRRLLGKWEPGKTDRRGWEWYFLHAASNYAAYVQTSFQAVDAAFTPDGSRYGFTNGIRLPILDAQTNQILNVISIDPHTRGLLMSLCFNADGSQVVVTTRAPYGVYVFDTTSGCLLHQSRIYDGYIANALWTKDGQNIVFLERGTQKNPIPSRVILWDAVTFSERVVEIGDTELVGTGGDTRCDLTHDGKHLVASIGGQRPGFMFLNTATWDVEKIVRAPFVCNSLSCHPSAPRVAVTHGPDGIGVWDADGVKLSEFTHDDSSFFTGVDWSPDGKHLVGFDRTFAITIWDVKSQQPTRRLLGHSSSSKRIQWSPKGDRIVSVTGPEIRQWDLTRHQPMQGISTLRPDGEWFNCLQWNRDGLVVRTTNASHFLSNDVLSRYAIQREAKVARQPFGLLSVDPDHKWKAGIVDQSRIEAWPAKETVRTQSSGLPRVLDPVVDLGEHPNSQIADIRWNPLSNGELLFTIKRDGIRLWLWNVVTGETFLMAEEPPGRAREFEWSPAGDSVVYSIHSTLALIDKRGKRIWVSPVFGQSTRSIVWSPDGSQLVRVGRRGTVIFLDALTGEVLRELVGHQWQLRDVAWSPDGARLATGGQDREVRIWDVASGETTLSLAHDDVIASLAWDPDGKRLASITGGGTLHIWDASSAYDARPSSQ
ncbi:MAG: WD40 repeat domain-containing serine/threonine-protein kinase [Planctomycetota bacterium]